MVLMLLIFYGLQIALNSLTEAVGLDQINIDPMASGIITLGFIYGAYFTETFRGAFLAVPRGQIEAATAFGLSASQTFRRILFPAMICFALPGIGNNWQVILKATALVSLLGLNDVVKATQLAGKGTYQPFYFAIVAGVVYLLFTTLSNGVLLWSDGYRFTGLAVTLWLLIISVVLGGGCWRWRACRPAAGYVYRSGCLPIFFAARRCTFSCWCFILQCTAWKSCAVPMC